MALLAFGLACVAHLAPHRSARPSVAVGHGSRCSAAATAAGAPDGGGGFRALLPSLPAAAAESLSARGIDTPTPIQAAALARIDAGESLLLHAETGSGKSLAFLLPALRHISPRSKLLLIAPTRELAVQLAAEASPLLPAGETVAILSVGSAPAPREVMAASVLACTSEAMAEQLAASGAVASSLDQALCDLRLVVLDEIDCLLPIETFRGPRAERQRRAANRDAAPPPAEALLRRAIELCGSGELQVVAASATLSRASRNKLGRVLRADPLGRWYGNPPAVVRPAQLSSSDLSAVPRAVPPPASIRHSYVRLPLRTARFAHVGTVAHERAAAGKAGRAAAPLAARGRRGEGRGTLKEKRKAKLARAAAEAAALREARTHPLLRALQCALREQRPASALVFLCRSSGLTVRRASKQLKELGLPAVALHEAIGLEHDRSPSASPPAAAALGGGGGGGGNEWWLRAEGNGVVLRGDGAVAEAGVEAGVEEGAEYAGEEYAGEYDGDDDDEQEEHGVGGRGDSSSDRLRQRQRELAASFRASAGLHAVDEPAADAGQPAEAPLVVTFEDMARGLHFDGVETVYILGLPDSPATYLHLAGRTGRQPVLSGTVVTLCPGNSHQQLTSWAQRLGGVEFERIELDGLEEALSASA